MNAAETAAERYLNQHVNWGLDDLATREAERDAYIAGYNAALDASDGAK